MTLSGWVNGDFDYRGTVDATDHALIDNAFALQVGSLSEEFLANYNRHFARFGQSYVDALALVQSGAAVPEPAVGLALVGGFVGLVGRRPRRRR